MKLATTCGNVMVGDLWEDNLGEINIVTQIFDDDAIKIEVVNGLHPGSTYDEMIENFCSSQTQTAFFTRLISRTCSANILPEKEICNGV